MKPSDKWDLSNIENRPQSNVNVSFGPKDQANAGCFEHS